MVKQVKGWARNKNLSITREFKFKNFKEAIAFTNKVADIAESVGHHPDIGIFYNKVKLTLFTHSANRLTEKDFILAAKIDATLKPS